MSVHADFEKNPAARWKSGGLKDLFAALSREAERAGGAWAKRVLRQGAWVGLRLAEGGRELRIFRRDRPLDDPDGKKWEQELGIFLRDFGCADWERIDSPQWHGPIASFKEPASLL